MQAKHLLQLTLDMTNPTAETLAAISAIVGSIRNKDDQQKLLKVLHDETGKLIPKGDVGNEPIHESTSKGKHKSKF